MENWIGVNPGKEEFVESRDRQFACYAIRTSVITKEDRLEQIIEQFVAPAALPGDVIFISEKMIACVQGRAYPIKSIKTGFFAKVLSKFVTKSPYGIGLAMPQTMQCAIWEIGLPRILLASVAGAVGKLFHKSGWFYRIAGTRAAAIDGPCSYTLPPYNEYVVLSPTDPDSIAKQISMQLNRNPVLIIDANDLGCNILGVSSKSLNRELYAALLQQNPLGQSTQCTPIGILRPISNIDEND